MRLNSRASRMMLSIVIAVAIAATAGVVAVLSDDRSQDHRTSAILPPAVETSTTETSADTTLTTPSPATLPIPIRFVVSSDEGIDLISVDDDVLRLWAEPTAFAIAVSDALVVAQASVPGDASPLEPDGPLLTFDPNGSRVLPGPSGEQIVLHDAALINGAPLALATVRTGTTPTDTVERLVLIDLTTADRTDLVTMDGWESSVRQARFANNHVAVVLFGMQNGVEIRTLDGRMHWGVPSGGLEEQNVIIPYDDELLVVERGFVGEAFDPRLTITTYDIATGSERGTTTIALRLEPGLAIEGGFCSLPDGAGDLMLCDQTYGGPLSIELATGATSALGEFDSGVPTATRSPTGPSNRVGEGSSPHNYKAIPRPSHSREGVRDLRASEHLFEPDRRLTHARRASAALVTLEPELSVDERQRSSTAPRTRAPSPGS